MSVRFAPDGNKLKNIDCLIVDTGVIICHLRNLPGVKELLTRLAEHTSFVLSVISAVEIWQGTKPVEAEKTRFLLQGFKVIPLDQHLAEQAGSLAYRLRAKGFIVGLADAVIGATALHLQVPVLTTNYKHFAVIPNLEVWDLGTLLREFAAEKK